MNLGMFSPLCQRLIASGFCLGLVFAAIYFSYTPVLEFLVPVVTLLTAGLAVSEYYKIAQIKGLKPQLKLGLCLTLFYILALFLTADKLFGELLPLMGVVGAMIAVFSFYLMRGEDPFQNIAATLFGFVYIVLPVGGVIQVNYFFPQSDPQDGRWWVLYVLGVTYLTDSAAYFAGKNFGKNKLAPYISPNKTWEGALGGFLVAVFISFLFAYFADKFSLPIKLSYGDSLLLGGILSILAQLGDLSESLLKRDAKVKDSSKIPGLGGMLDVIDSLIFTTPIVYLYLKFKNF